MDDDLITLANEALARMGESPIGIEEETDLAATVSGITPRVVDARLSQYAGAFNTFTMPLTRDDTAKYRAGYAYAFRQPGGRLRGPLRVMGANQRDLVRDYVLENDYLFASAEALFAAYIMRPPIGQWPPLLREALILMLARDFCLAIPAKLDFADAFSRQAFGLPSERGRGGVWGEFIIAQNKDGGHATPFGRGDWATSARGLPAGGV